MVSAQNLPSEVNQHRVDNSETIIKLLQAALSTAQGSTDDEQMKDALVQAIGEEITTDTQDSQEKLERALQQLFDMPSFPIIRLYPNDG